MALQAALAAFSVGHHDVLTKFVAKYEGKSLDLLGQNLGAVGALAVAKGLQVNTLRTLDLEENNIGTQGAEHIAEALKMNTSLRELDMQSNDIGAEGARAFGEALKENKTLRELNMYNNSIGPDGAKAFAKALEVNSSLTQLSLWNNKIGNAGAIAIGKGLEANKVLQTLIIEGNNIGDQGAAAFADALKVNKTLREINLAWNKIGDAGAQAIGGALKVNQSIEQIWIQGNWIPVASFRDVKTTNIDLSRKNYGDLDAIIIASLLKENKECKLEKLDISSNSIGAEGARHIAKALEENKECTLQTLDISENDIGPKGAAAIANMLKVNMSLKALSLRNNDIGPEGTKAIAAALEVNKILHEINLGWNTIGDAGAQAIGEALKENKNSKLSILDISLNYIGPQGAKHIAEAIQVNQSIEQIWIQGNWIPVASFRDGKTTNIDLSRKNYGDLDAIIIASLLKVNNSIRSIDLNDNHIGDEGVKAIGLALQNNTTLTTLDGVKNKNALKIVETNRLREQSRVTELGELCSQGAARVRVVGPADNRVLFEKGTDLQELVLQSSTIVHQPSFQELLLWIAKHRHLRRLRLNAIGLTDDDLSLLVSSQDGLTFLEELDLRANRLTTVPAELGDAKRFGKLQKLQVSRNAELLKRDDELGRRARSDVSILGVDAGIQVLQLLRLGSSNLKQVPRTRLQLVTVGNFKAGKSTLLERGWLAPSLKRETAKWSRLERTTSVLLFSCMDSEAGLHWMVRDLPGQPEFYATNLHFLSADCAVFLLVCKATDDERTREQQLRLWLGALDSLGAYHRACCTVLVCTHQDQLDPPELQRAQEWLQQLAPRLSSEFKHAHLDASGMLLDCETRKAPAMLEELRKRVAQAGRNLLRLPDLANVPEFLVLAQDGLAKWRQKHLTKWHASYAEALEIVKSLLPTSAPELVLRELIYQGDVMEFGTELVLSPLWLALALAVIVRPHERPFNGLKTKRGGVSREEIQKALLGEYWPASMVPTLSEQEASVAGDDAAMDSKTKAKQGSQAGRRKSKMGKCEVCKKAWTMTRKHHHCHKCSINVCSGCSELISRKRLCLRCKVGPKLAREEDVPQVLRFLQLLDVIAPLSHKHESLSAAAPAPEPTEDSQAAATQPLPLLRQPSTDISSAEQIMIPSSVGERYSGVIFAPPDLGFGFGERCLAAGVKVSQRKTTELLFPPGFMAVLAPRLLSKKLGSERLAIYFGTHEFCFREVDQPRTGDKGAVRVVLDEQGSELFLCVAGSKGFLLHYASSFVQEVLTVLRLRRWGRAEESACVAHLLCQNCVLKGRGPARDTSQASDEICEVLDKQAWATGREGLSVLWGLSRHDDVRGQHAKAGSLTRDFSIRLVLSMPFNGLLAMAHCLS
eukprot:g78450.t1